MPKKKTRGRIPRATRASILATAKAKGWTAEMVAKKYGVSKWTYYGWKKRSTTGTKRGTRAANTGRGASGASGAIGITTASLQSEIRAILPAILSEEIALALKAMIGTGAKRRGRRGGRK